MDVNMSEDISAEGQIAHFFTAIGQPVRIQILSVIAREPACVCHLEAALGLRQASISQHLMILRKAGLVTTQREGRNIFYRITRSETIPVIEQIAGLANLPLDTLHYLARRPIAGCPCPQCNPGLDSEFTCKKIAVSHS
jgi:ArsR family transcriptional regulator